MQWCDGCVQSAGPHTSASAFAAAGGEGRSRLATRQPRAVVSEAVAAAVEEEKKEALAMDDVIVRGREARPAR